MSEWQDWQTTDPSYDCVPAPIASGIIASTYEGAVPLDDDEWPRLPRTMLAPDFEAACGLDIYMSLDYPKLPWHLWLSLRQMDDGWEEEPRPSVVGHALAAKQCLLRRRLLDMMERTGDKALAEELSILIFSHLAEITEVELGPNPTAEHIETVIESMLADHPSSNLRRVARTAFEESIVYSNFQLSAWEGRDAFIGPDTWLTQGIEVQRAMLSPNLSLRCIGANIMHLQIDVDAAQADYDLARFNYTHDDYHLGLLDQKTRQSFQLASVCPALQTLTVTLKGVDWSHNTIEADLSMALRRLSTGVYHGLLQLFFEGLLHVTSSKPSLRTYVELLGPSQIWYSGRGREPFRLKSQELYHGVLLRTKLDRSRPVDEMLEEFHAFLEEASKITLAREEYERAQQDRIMSDELEEVEA